MKTVAVGIRVPEELWKQAREFARKRKTTFSQLANKGLVEIMRPHQKKAEKE